MIGVGAGVLLAAFMEFREAPVRRPTDRQKNTDEAPDTTRNFSANTNAEAARA
jgi:hypothetical protein